MCIYNRPYIKAEPILEPFWSYRAGWRNGHMFPFVQNNLANNLLYIPVGFFISGCFLKPIDDVDIICHKYMGIKIKSNDVFLADVSLILLFSALAGA